MTKYRIKLFLRKKRLSAQFLTFFKRVLLNLKNSELNFKLIGRKKKRGNITVLKSPHVNKNAQEHFQILTHKTTLDCSVEKMRKTNILIKKIKNHVFSDVKIKIDKTFNIVCKKNPKSDFFSKLTPKLKKKRSIVSLFGEKQKQKRVLLPNKAPRKLLKTVSETLQTLSSP